MGIGTRTSGKAWISATECRRLAGCGPRIFSRLVASGRIGVRNLPGAKPLFNVADLESLLVESTRDATREDRDD